VKSPGGRLAITIAVPIAIYFISGWVLVPGADQLLGALRPSDRGILAARSLSVFALGVMPALTAFAFVEITAFLVPRWARLRHGNPEGRAKLTRAARFVTMVFAAFQGFGVAQRLTSLDEAPAHGILAIVVITATLVAGVCVLMIAAEWITRQRIANGYVLLVVVAGLIDFLQETYRGVQKHLGGIEPAQWFYLLASMGLAVVASVIVMRGANDARVAETSEKDGLYRVASGLTIHPWLPIPASSFAAYTFATSLLLFPSAYGHLFGIRHNPLEKMATLPFAAIELTTIAVIAFVLAAMLHRPKELDDLASRLGLDVAPKSGEALGRAMPATLLFFAALVVAGSIAVGARFLSPSITFMPLAVALVIDMISAVRRPALVPVWQERRASAAPIVRAVLEAEGIDVETRGLATLSLLQVFAPYAPAEIVVAEADAPRATAVLRHVFLGEPKPEGVPAKKPPTFDPTRTRRITVALAAVSVGGVIAAVAANRPRERLAPDERRPDLEVVLVDDRDDTIQHLDERDLPAGFEIRFENAPNGPARYIKTYFVKVLAQPNEKPDAVFARAERWSQTVQIPADKHIVWESLEDWDPDTGTATFSGVRTFIVTGAPILTTADVVEATPAVNEQSGMPEVYVAVTLSPDAADRFEWATGAHVQERIAIIVDGRINSAPVVKSKIGGGRISITMGVGDPELQIKQAKDLARGLGAPR
jgi:hypothetical protein